MKWLSPAPLALMDRQAAASIFSDCLQKADRDRCVAKAAAIDYFKIPFDPVQQTSH